MQSKKEEEINTMYIIDKSIDDVFMNDSFSVVLMLSRIQNHWEKASTKVHERLIQLLVDNNFLDNPNGYEKLEITESIRELDFYVEKITDRTLDKGEDLYLKQKETKHQIKKSLKKILILS